MPISTEQHHVVFIPRDLALHNKNMLQFFARERKKRPVSATTVRRDLNIKHHRLLYSRSLHSMTLRLAK